MERAELLGYRRGGAVGLRSRVVAMASVSCANSVVERLARRYPEVVPVTHQHGCSLLAADREVVLRTLAGTGGHPNVAGVLIVGLGCEGVAAEEVAGRIATDGRLVRTLVIQQVGRADVLMARAAAYLEEMLAVAASAQREPFEPSELVVGLECGGSDPFSGMTANPVVGLVSDRLVAAGATAVLSEVPEMIGAEAALAGRIPDPAVRRRLLGRIAEYVRLAREHGTDLLYANPSPGNIRAGLSTIEEKSLGCIAKGGSSEVVEFVEYAARPGRRGLVVMDTPGNDAESVTGMVAGGAQVVLFTTGVGTPLGNPVAPVVKVASNSRTFESMRDFLDLDAGGVLAGRAPEDVADELYALLLAVCGGRQTAAERNGCREFAIRRLGPTL